MQDKNRVARGLFRFKRVNVGLFWLFVFVLLAAQIWRSGWCHNESSHIPSGLYHLETSRMDAYRVNPPLPRMLAAIPLLIDRPKMNWFSYDVPQSRNEYTFAQQWIRGNLPDIPRQLRLARSMMILFFLLGAWTIFRWASELYGNRAGWLALAMWSISPDVITYSATVAPDLPAAATGLYACHSFSKWLFGSKNKIPWEVSLAVALATLSKFSWLFLFVLIPFVTLIHDLLGRFPEDSESCNLGTMTSRYGFACYRASKLALALLVSVLIINVAYGFEGTGRRLGDFEFLSIGMGGERESQVETGNRFRGSMLGSIPMPIPCEMLRGIDYLKWEFELGMPCYLLGEWKHGGWWYYYLVAMAVKFPVGYFVLIAIGGGSMFVNFLRRESVRGEWLVPMIAVLFVAQVSSQTGFTHHMRYVLPSFGFLYIMGARSILVLPRRFGSIFVSACLLGTVVFHFSHIGLAHSHFNWIAGGPKNGWRYLSLSNIDWGQSTFRIADWARTHTEKRALTVVFVSELGSPSRLLSDLDIANQVNWQAREGDHGADIPIPGGYLLSAEQLTHKQNLYFRTNKPVSWPFADVALFYVPTDD